MNKVLEIGYPMEYEDDNHIIRTGLWLKEYEVELLEKKLQELKQLKKQKDDVVELIKARIKENEGHINARMEIYHYKNMLRMLGEENV